MSAIFKDSKTFVDMKLKSDPHEVQLGFKELKATGDEISEENLKSFLNDHFDYHGTELVKYLPRDWDPNPEFLDHVRNKTLRKWASAIHKIWKILCRTIRPDVNVNRQRYSLMYLPKPFVINGGRFRETYYWDSYWVIRGLLRSGMKATAKGMIDNLFHLLNQFGYVPSCGRIYCLGRSQPPLLIQMVDEYVQHTGDKSYVRNNIHRLVMEFSFWMTKRTVKIKRGDETYTLAMYAGLSKTPRPESYRKDYELIQDLPPNRRENAYSQITASAESGWYFSSRWFNEDNYSKLDLTVKHIIPVDLNAILCSNAQVLSKFYRMIGSDLNAQKYDNISFQFWNGMRNVMWNKRFGIWMDYNLTSGLSTNKFFPTNLSPFWLSCSYNIQNLTFYKQKIVKYFKMVNSSLKLTDYGIPTSYVHTGEKWDFPYAWAPLQDIMVTALERTGAKGKKIGYSLAKSWLETVYRAFVNKKRMYESYDLSKIGREPAEYDVELGFGWTNAIAQEYLYRFGRDLYLSI